MNNVINDVLQMGRSIYQVRSYLTKAGVYIGYLNNYWLITLKAIRAFGTPISRAFQTTSWYDFRPSQKNSKIFTYACTWLHLYDQPKNSHININFNALSVF